MYLDTQVITYIIGGLMLFILLTPVLVKQYYINKTKGKILVRVVNASEEEKCYLLKMEGLTTEPNKKNRAYVIKGKKQVEDLSQDKKSRKGEWAGNTFETCYPEGMPRFLQVRVRAMCTPEGNPMGINFYGSQEGLKLTDFEVGTIHKEAFSKVAVAASDDSKDLVKELRGITKPLNKTVMYIALGIIIVGILGIAFLSFQNSQALSELGSMWGW